MTTEPISDQVEYCSGLCINPETIKTDALRLMAYSNSIEVLRKRGAKCPVTDANLDRNIFTEVLSLVVTLSLRCRLWNDSYRRTIDLGDVENSVVGIRRNGSKAGKNIKLREVTSFIAHASGFWFDPFVIHADHSGANFSISVPHDSQRLNKINTSIDLILAELAQETEDGCADIIAKLQSMKMAEPEAGSKEPDRIYTINLDDFACAVCEVVDYCHSCAGESGFVALGDDGFPDFATSETNNLTGWVAQIIDTANTEVMYMGVEGRSKAAAIKNSRTAIGRWYTTAGKNTLQVELIAEYDIDSTLLNWLSVEEQLG